MNPRRHAVKSQYTHRQSYRLQLENDADHRAPGGAVTVALCGHWDHDGPCRWPHFSTITPTDEGLHLLVVDFDASEEDVVTVKSRIDAGLESGQLTGPDGRLSVWTVVQSVSHEPR
mgnify:FL=1